MSAKPSFVQLVIAEQLEDVRDYRSVSLSLIAKPEDSPVGRSFLDVRFIPPFSSHSLACFTLSSASSYDIHFGGVAGSTWVEHVRR